MTGPQGGLTAEDEVRLQTLAVRRIVAAAVEYRDAVAELNRDQPAATDAEAIVRRIITATEAIRAAVDEMLAAAGEHPRDDGQGPGTLAGRPRQIEVTIVDRPGRPADLSAKFPPVLIGHMNAAIREIVERTFPTPRQRACQPIADMERALQHYVREVDRAAWQAGRALERASAAGALVRVGGCCDLFRGEHAVCAWKCPTCDGDRADCPEGCEKGWLVDKPVRVATVEPVGEVL